MATLRSAVRAAAKAYKEGLTAATPLNQTFNKFNFETGYYNQIGLVWHDLVHLDPLAKEAVRRLPREELEARDFRIARAFQLNGNKQILPQDQWTKQEDDIPYLEPYVKIIRQELKDKSDWDHFANPEHYS